MTLNIICHEETYNASYYRSECKLQQFIKSLQNLSRIGRKLLSFTIALEIVDEIINSSELRIHFQIVFK